MFNYELNENKIRTTLQDAKQAVYSEHMWEDFEANYAVSKQLRKSPIIKLPDFHLNINRNVIVPLFFILALVGVSALLINFIDFKSKEESQVEKKLEPNPENFKPVKKENRKAAESESKKVEKPILTTKKAEPLNQISSKNEQPTIVEVSKIEPTITSELSQANKKLITTIIPESKNEAEKASPATALATDSNNKDISEVRKPKRRRAVKIPSEQMETIKAPELIKTQTEVSEPELEIKLD